MDGCKAKEKQVFSWGGPLVSFRIDSTNCKVKYASVREIVKPIKDSPLHNLDVKD